MSDDDHQPQLPPADWYPQAGGTDLWWDGSAWTDRRRPTPGYRPPLRARLKYFAAGDLRSVALIVGGIVAIASVWSGLSAAGGRMSGGYSPEDKEQRAYGAMSDCWLDQANHYAFEGAWSSALYLSNVEKAAAVSCVADDLAADDLDGEFDCDTDGCYRDGRGWTWEVIAQHNYCDLYGNPDDSCLPGNQAY